MMAFHFAATWINGEVVGRGNVLPCPFFARVGVFSAQRIGKIDFTISPSKIILMQFFTSIK